MILLQLLWSFTKIGFTSFGGLSMIPLISSEMQVHQWMTAEEVSDIVAIAEMTPGRWASTVPPLPGCAPPVCPAPSPPIWGC